MQAALVGTGEAARGEDPAPPSTAAEWVGNVGLGRPVATGAWTGTGAWRERIWPVAQMPSDGV